MEAGLPLKNYAVLHPAPLDAQTLACERWIEVARTLLEDLDSVLISAGPDPEETMQAEELARAIGRARRAPWGAPRGRSLPGCFTARVCLSGRYRGHASGSRLSVPTLPYLGQPASSIGAPGRQKIS